MSREVSEIVRVAERMLGSNPQLEEIVRFVAVNMNDTERFVVGSLYLLDRLTEPMP